MNVEQFLGLLEAHPNQALCIVLPNGVAIPSNRSQQRWPNPHADNRAETHRLFGHGLVLRTHFNTRNSRQATRESRCLLLA